MFSQNFHFVRSFNRINKFKNKDMKKIFSLIIVLIIAISVYSQDVIIRKNGDIMPCTITKIDSSKIYFSLTRNGNTLATEINKTEVQDLRFGLNNSNAASNQNNITPDSTQLNNNGDENSNLEKLTKYRNIILDNIVSGNKAKAKEIIEKAYKIIGDKNYVLLFPNEKCLLSFWEGDYKQISHNLMNLDSIEYANTLKINPNPDQ